MCLPHNLFLGFALVRLQTDRNLVRRHSEKAFNPERSPE